MTDKSDLSKALLDEHAKAEVLRIAVATLARQLLPGQKKAFLAAFLGNVENWESLALTTSNPDMWIESLRSHADRLRAMIEE